MNVDRARFLLLTTALSAATAVAMSATGCSATSDTKDGGSSSGTTPETDSGTGTDATTDAYSSDASTDSGACLDDTGLAPTCEGAALNCATICQHFIPTYKNAVGRAITECIVALPSCEGIGTDTLIAECVQKGLAAACPDPTAEGYCAPLSTACGDADGGDAGAAALPLPDCITLATGLNATGRTAFSACINNSMGANYCVADPITCVDTLK
jgi:hypothetical protein